MAALVNPPPRLLLTWQNTYLRTSNGSMRLFNNVTVLHSHRYFPEIPALPIATAQALFLQIRDTVFHRQCHAVLNGQDVFLSLQILPSTLQETLQLIEIIARQAGLHCGRLSSAEFLEITESPEARERLRKRWAEEAPQALI